MPPLDELMREVYDLLSDESRWCQGHMALGATGEEVSPFDSKACRWCLEGAIQLVDRRNHLSFDALDCAICSELNEFLLYRLNDDALDHADFLRKIEPLRGSD